MKFGLREKDLEVLKEILFKPLMNQNVKVWVFGSRARGDHREFSDIDILYSTEKNILPDGLISKIKENLEDSNLPIKVDLVAIDELAASYKDQVLKDRIVVS